jgi:hypothetical protein
MLAQEHWDTHKAKEVAQSILTTRDQATVHSRQVKEMKNQLLDYMSVGKIADFPLETSNKKLVAVETPVRLSLIEAIRIKFTQDGTDTGTIDDWLKEVKEIRRSGVKSMKRVMKITKIRKEKAGKNKNNTKESPESKDATSKSKSKSNRKRSRDNIPSGEEPQNKKRGVTTTTTTTTTTEHRDPPSLLPNAPMQVLVEGENKR